jgi:hypothetical protein
MAIPRGVFDPAAVPAGWWDETAQPAGWFDAQLLDGAAPAQEILPGLLENEQQFYGATVTGSYGIAAPLLANEQAFYAPTVAAGAVELLPPLLANEQQFYAARVGQPQPYESSRLLPGGAVFQWSGDELAYLLPGGQVVQPPSQAAAPPTPPAAVGLPWRDRGPPALGQFDDRDLLELLPIVIGALNASRTH